VHKAEEIILSVQDYGSGIPEKVLKRLRDKKHTFSTSGTANEKGSGIGLAISIELLESFNGSIEFESKIDEGSKAMIKIPASNE
jgi:signal transduction histidine kinase